MDPIYYQTVDGPMARFDTATADTLSAAVIAGQRIANANGSPVAIWEGRVYVVSEVAPEEWLQAPEMDGWTLSAIVDPDLAPSSDPAPQSAHSATDKRPEGGSSARREGDMLPAPNLCLFCGLPSEWHFDGETFLGHPGAGSWGVR